MKNKRWIAILLTGCMIFSLLPTAAFAEEETETPVEIVAETSDKEEAGVPELSGETMDEPTEEPAVEPAEELSEEPVEDVPADESVEDEFAGNDGVAALADEVDPWAADEITISTLEELKEFAGLVNGGNAFNGQTITLGADLDLGGEEWTPIGTEAHPFQGIFDGGGNTVSNLTVNGGDFAGLFGRVMTGKKTAVVKNVTIHNAAVSGGQCVGALAGSAYTGIVENCHVTGNIQITGAYDVGGLTGYGYARLTDCSVVGNDGSAVTGNWTEGKNREGDNVGGLVGYLAEGSVAMTNCSVENLTVTGTRKVGGLLGSTYANRSLIDCSAKNIIVGTNATGEYADDNKKTMGVGGLIGLFNNTNTTDYKDGAMSDCSVENITLTNKNGVSAKMGYVSGGTRVSEDFGEPIMTFTNVTISGANTGSNVTIHSPALSGNAVETANSVAQVGGQYFESLQAAIAAAQDGDAVKLLADVTLADRVGIQKSLTIKGGKADGGKPVITLTNSGNNQGFILGKTYNYKVTFEDLHMVAGKDNQIFIYQDGDSVSHEITVSNCEFTMADGVTKSGSVVTSCDSGTGSWSGKVIFTDNTVDLLTGSILPGLGSGSIVAGNTFIMQSDRTTEASRTGIMSLAPSAAEVTITGNTFRGANRVLAIDDSKKITPAGLTYKENAFIDCLWALEVDSGKGQKGYDLSGNYYMFHGDVAEARAEDGAKKTGGLTHFDVEIAAGTDSVVVTSYYAQRDEDGTLSDLRISSAVVAQVGGDYYTTLQAAVDAAQDGDAVMLLADVDANAFIDVNKSITIEGGNHTVNSTASRILRITESNVTVTLNNIKFVSAVAERGVQVDSDKTGVVLNINGCTVPGTSYAVNMCSNTSVALNIADSTISGWGALNLWGNNYEVKVTNSTLKGHNDKSYNAAGWNGFGVVVLEGDTTGQTDEHVSNCHVVLENCHIIASTAVNAEGNGNVQKVILFNNPSTNNLVEITGDDTVVEYEQGEFTPFCKQSGSENELVVSGGTFSGDVTEYRAAGYVSHLNEDGLYHVHREETGYGSDSTGHWSVCSAVEGCLGIEKETQAHTFGEWVTDTAAQAGATGSRHQDCTLCSYRVTETIPALPETPGSTGPSGNNPGSSSGGGGSSSGGSSRPTVTPTPAPAPAEEDLGEEEVPLAQPMLFTDVAETDWYYDAVRFAFDRDMMKGMNDEGTIFAPLLTTTRSMVVTILYRLEEEPETASASFTDVGDGSWYAAAVNWAAASGVVKGYEDGSFRPNGTITREEMAVILARYARAKGFDMTIQGDMSLYNDKTLISAWAQEDMAWAVGVKLLQGRENGLLDPKGTTSRAEAAQMLKNFCETFLSEENAEA